METLEKKIEQLVREVAAIRQSVNCLREVLHKTNEVVNTLHLERAVRLKTKEGD